MRALMVIISNANKGVGSVVVMSRSGSGISMLMRLATLQDPITTNVSVSESFFFFVVGEDIRHMGGRDDGVAVVVGGP